MKTIPPLLFFGVVAGPCLKIVLPFTAGEVNLVMQP